MKISSINNNSFKAKNISKNFVIKQNSKKISALVGSDDKKAKEIKAIGQKCYAENGKMNSVVALQMSDIASAIAGGILLFMGKLGINSSKNDEQEINDNSNIEPKSDLQEPETENSIKENDVQELENSTQVLAEQIDIDPKLKDLLASNLGTIGLYRERLEYFGFDLSNQELGKALNYYMELQLQDDENRRIPMHKFTSKEMDTVIRNLSNYPDLVAELMTTKDVNGEIPIHKFINDDYSINNLKNFETIFYALDSNKQLNYQTLLTVFEAKNANGISAIDWLKVHRIHYKTGNKRVPFADSMLGLLHLCKNDYEKETRKEFKPFRPVSDLKRETYIANEINKSSGMNIDNILEILSNKEVCKSKGGDLNSHDNYIAEVIEFLINNANKEERNKIVSKLKELTRIDYDKVDYNGISSIELIMNAEDDELLELVKNNTFKYRPELDCVYNNIQNPNFKEKIKDLKFDFLDLREAVENFSVRNLEKYISHSNSPLYKKEVHGLDMKVPPYKMMPPDFITKYNEYYSRLVKQN